MVTPEVRAEILDNLKAKVASLPEENILKVALASSIENLDLSTSTNTYRDIANSVRAFLDVPDLFVWHGDVKSFADYGRESTKIQQIERAISAFRMIQAMRDGNLASVASSMLTKIVPENTVLPGNMLDLILLNNLVRRWDYQGIAENMLIAMIAADENNPMLHKKDLSKKIANVLPTWFSALEENFRIQTKS